jgi:prepilin-type N-terminal cleavage/methylation domain-containing protein
MWLKAICKEAYMKSKGFTLIELMVVVVIIGILAAIAIPNFISMQKRAKEASTKNNMHTCQLAAEDFSTITEGIYANDFGSTVGQVRTAVYGVTDPLSGDLRSIGGIATGDPDDTNPILLPVDMRNPIVGANNTFQLPCIAGLGGGAHDPTTVGTVGYEAYNVADVITAVLGDAVRYRIDGDGVDDLLPLVLTSGQ